MTDTPLPHPNSAHYDDQKAQLREDLENFNFPKPADDIHVFSPSEARERLATVLAQIYEQKLDVTIDGYTYKLADEIIDIIGTQNNKEKK